MTDTPHLGLPFIEGSQAQKHVTHNEALRILDALVQIGVLDADRTAPPPSPAEGDRHIVASGATGAWAGQARTIALYEDGGWRFFAPRAGWCAWSAADGVLLVHDGAAWGEVASGGGGDGGDGGGIGDSVAKLGVNDTATAPNLLTVRSSDALFHAIVAADGGSGNVRLQIAKEGAANTASVFFSDAYAGHAEFGLTGDNDFHLKVSADGTTWRDAVTFDRTTGRASFPGGGVREILAANRTYYVRTDGSDSNNGLSNTSGGAFLTIQKAWNAVLTLDLAGFTVTIQLADGTYTAGLSISAPALGGLVILNGNSSTPTNVVISTTICVSLSAPGSAITVQNLRLSGSTMGLLVSSPGAMITMGPGLSFAGSPTQSHINIRQGKVSSAGNNFTIASGGLGWLLVQQYGVFETADLTITFSGTPAWTSEGIIAVSGLVSLWNTIISGAATGKRYAVSANGVINSFGAGTASSYFPGSSNGTIASGGQQN